MEPFLASHNEVQARLFQLIDTAKNYTSPFESAEATKVRMDLIAQANELIRALTSPTDTGALLMAQVCHGIWY
jgi:hypothetical protein